MPGTHDIFVRCQFSILQCLRGAKWINLYQTEKIYPSEHLINQSVIFFQKYIKTAPKFAMKYRLEGFAVKFVC